MLDVSPKAQLLSQGWEPAWLWVVSERPGHSGGVWNKVQGRSRHLVGHAAGLDTQVSLSLPSGSLSDPCLVAVSSDALFSWSIFSTREVVRPPSSEPMARDLWPDQILDYFLSQRDLRLSYWTYHSSLDTTFPPPAWASSIPCCWFCPLPPCLLPHPSCQPWALGTPSCEWHPAPSPPRRLPSVCLLPLELGPLYNDEKELFARLSSVCLGQHLLKYDAQIANGIW